MITRVKHPVLRLDVVHGDGSRVTDFRVFCSQQRCFVPVSRCAGCPRLTDITAGAEPSIACTVDVAQQDLAPDPSGESTAVGAVLARGALVVEPVMSVREAFALLRAEERRSLAVVDAAHVLVGVVHEGSFVKPAVVALEDVGHVMSSATVAMHESTPVRRALHLLASAHLREATVVDDAGVPIGTFRDVDGLHWLALARGAQK